MLQESWGSLEGNRHKCLRKNYFTGPRKRGGGWEWLPSPLRLSPPPTVRKCCSCDIRGMVVKLVTGWRWEWLPFPLRLSSPPTVHICCTCNIRGRVVKLVTGWRFEWLPSPLWFFPQQMVDRVIGSKGYHLIYNNYSCRVLAYVGLMMIVRVGDLLEVFTIFFNIKTLTGAGSYGQRRC